MAVLPSPRMLAPQPPSCGSITVYWRPVSGWMPPMNVPQIDAKCPAARRSGMWFARHRHIRSYTRSSIS